MNPGAARDLQLQQRLRDGDMAALEALYDAHAGPLYRQALQLLGSPPDAEDVLQNVFVKFAQRHGTLVRDLPAYLHTAARHEAISLLRRRRRELSGADAERLEDTTPPRPSLRQDSEEMRVALEGLPAVQREVVLLKVVDEMTFAEIGRRLKVSANTAASRYRYALKKLRDALGESANG